MDEVRLRVQTVPALDPVSFEEHIAYTVMLLQPATGLLFSSSGWTLRDAIEFFCDMFHVNRDLVKPVRPFYPQRIEDDGYFR